MKAKVETAFCLQPLKIVEIHVKFNAPKASEQTEWPMIMQNIRQGELQAAFSNGDMQSFNLLGQLLRPKLILLTEFSSRNDKAQDELDFAVCNVDMKRTITIFLSNITEVTANWMLNYVKFPKKQTISKYTTTAWEDENLEKVDDPDVFEFEFTQVSLFEFSNVSVSLLLYRDPLKENQSHFVRSLKALLSLLCLRTNTRSSSSLSRSKSTSDLRRTSSISRSSDSPSRTVFPATSFSKEEDRTKKTTTEQITERNHAKQRSRPVAPLQAEQMPSKRQNITRLRSTSKFTTALLSKMVLIYIEDSQEDKRHAAARQLRQATQDL